MLGVITREYGISPTTALTEYTEDQLQGLVAELPTERIVDLSKYTDKVQAENKYLSALCDRIDITSDNLNTEEQFKKIERRAELKAKLRTAQSDDERTVYQNMLNDLK